MSRRTAPCPAEYTLGVIGGRWKVVILWQLFRGAQRFSDLFRALNGPTQKMLTQQLREMERDGLLHRQVYAQVPPKVEYSLTPLGMSLNPVVNAMCDWGRKHQEETGNVMPFPAVRTEKKANDGAKQTSTVRSLRRAVAG